MIATGGYLALGGLFLLMIGLYAWEKRRHEANLQAIALRIHVNGSRGKSSVTRLIAAGLRAGGHRVVAKTTGSAARIILADGSEQPLRRRGLANIRELIAFVRLAAAGRATAIVAECMAVRPELQRFAEASLLKSQIGVITNIRLDHEEVMGPGLVSIARALANTIPAGGILVTTAAAAALLEATGLPGGTLVSVADDLSAECLEGFEYAIFPENIALALAVCELAGVDRPTALAGMRQAEPDLGNVSLHTFPVAGKTVTLVNALAANDPESTRLLWQQYVEGAAAVLLNCRPDRKYRTTQLAATFAAIHRGPYLVAGDCAFGRRQLVNCGVDPGAIRLLPPSPALADVLAAAGEVAGERLTLFAAGNVRGLDHLPIWRQTGATNQCTCSF